MKPKSGGKVARLLDRGLGRYQAEYVESAAIGRVEALENYQMAEAMVTRRSGASARGGHESAPKNA